MVCLIVRFDGCDGIAGGDRPVPSRGDFELIWDDAKYALIASEMAIFDPTYCRECERIRSLDSPAPSRPVAAEAVTGC